MKINSFFKICGSPALRHGKAAASLRRRSWGPPLLVPLPAGQAFAMPESLTNLLYPSAYRSLVPQIYYPLSFSLEPFKSLGLYQRNFGNDAQDRFHVVVYAVSEIFQLAVILKQIGACI